MDIQAVKAEHAKFLRSLPNVVGVGIGPKMRGGRVTGETAIKVYVSQKLGPTELIPSDRVPPELGGYPTDVEEMSPLTARQQDQENES